MKRLAWLVILVFGAALAQVSPLDFGQPHRKACSCCKTPGDCGMPGCEFPAACAPNNFVGESPSSATAELSAQKVEVSRRERLLLVCDSSFSLGHPTQFCKVARVALFKLHCSFVI
ncbi:MAG TPA: hypothetical protein VGM64_11200 [Lacunisphaera sp.]|jgi:hypothetical protein